MSCTRRSARSRVPADESGMTLVELVIYFALTVLVGSIVLGVFIGTLQGQEKVTSVTTATTSGQVAAQSIERALRNARAIEISGEHGATIAIVTTLPGQKCQAWRVEGGELQVSTAAPFTSWGTLVNDVAQVKSLDYFVRVGAAYEYHLGFQTAGSPVDISGSVVPRNSSGSVAALCS